MLLDESPAVDADDFISGKSLLQDACRGSVIVGLGIGGVEHGVVENKEVGIGGRQPFPFVEDGGGHGQWQEPERLAVACQERAELLLHLGELRVVHVGFIVALHIHDGVVGTQPGQGVDVAVGIVAGQESVVEPQDLCDREGLVQVLFDLGAVPLSVPVGGEQAFRSGEQGPFPVRLDGAAFENEVQTVHVFTVEPSVLIHGSRYQVVEIGREFQSPTVECEVENPCFPAIPVITL